MLASVHVLARVPVHVLVVAFVKGLVLNILSCNQMLPGQQEIVADFQVVVAIHTFLPAVDLGPRVMHIVLGANDGTSRQENTAKKTLKRTSKNIKVSFASTWPIRVMPKLAARPRLHSGPKATHQRRKFVESPRNRSCCPTEVVIECKDSSFVA